MAEAKFLARGGEMGARMRAHDWAATPFGPPETWPQPLQTTVSTLLHSPQLGAILWGPDLLLLYNDAYVPALQERHPAALGRPLAEVWADIWDQLSGPFLRAFNTGEAVSEQRFELVMLRRGERDQTFWNYSVSPIHDLEGRVAGLLNNAIEITAQVRAEQRQAEAENRLREMNTDLRQEVSARTSERDRAWRLSQELLAIALPDGSLAAVNPIWTTLLGWEEQELIGRSFVEFTHPDDLEATQAAFADIFERPRTIPYEHRFRHKDGSYRSFSWVGVFEDGRIYAAGRDTTLERHQRDVLNQSQKMEAVGQLTGGLAHDFNNLLAVVIGSLDLLERRVMRGRFNDVERFVSAAQAAAKRATALTHRLLAFSRRQTLDPKPMDVNRLACGMDDMIRRTMGPSIVVETIGAAGLWTTLIDANQLENALLNLCINARDAMPDGGRLTIETANRWLDGHAARERDVSPGQYISLCVSDTGRGMPADVIAKAFDPFFTTKPLGQGTGLGLSTIYGFARQSGGQVRIYSEVDQGTMVCIYMPRHLGNATDAEDRAPAEPQRAEQGDTVLVVEDEFGIRTLVGEVLRDLGYSAIEAVDGPTALNIIQSGVRIDLLVTDVGLPGGLNGRQVADAARVSRPDLKVLFITGYAENALVGNGHLDHGMSVMTKPFAVDDLANRIKALIVKD